MIIQIPKEVEQELKEDNENESIQKRIDLILKGHYQLKVADVTSWYFRLNGFFTITDFVLHSSIRSEPGQRTDADLVGIRFPDRRELDFKDDKHFADLKIPVLAIVEVTKGVCKINGPWSKKEKKNINYLLESLGLFDPKDLEKIAEALYKDCRYPGEFAHALMFAVGQSKSSDLSREKPGVIQITTSEMLGFIYRRFSDRRWRKEDHQSWDRVGQVLWNKSRAKSEGDFLGKIQKLLAGSATTKTTK